MISFLCALQFLTLFPPLVKRQFTQRELGGSIAFYPLVGFLLGGILFGLNLLLGRFAPTEVRAALVLTIWIALTGALHLDGFLDSMDGLFGGFTPSKRLEIMRDERIGAFGFAAGGLLLLLKYSALTNLSTANPVLILIPMFSRWGISLAVGVFPYGRDQGLGREIKDNIRQGDLWLAAGIVLALGWLLMGWPVIITAGFVAGTIWLIGVFILRKIPGMTGDIYGAMNEIIEVIFLILASGGWLI
jgi:adenosylcobinamide-GDP ribazoletransferase